MPSLTDAPSPRAVIDAAFRQNLQAFYLRAWQEIEPSPLNHNWHIDCICAHLESLVRGDLPTGNGRRLIINVPPRTGKTLLTNVAFPAWIMGRNPGSRIIGVSYAHRLAEKIAFRQRTLMESAWYRSLFPACVLDPAQSQKSNFMTTSGGGRFSTSVGGTMTGEGGNFVIIDDPMNPAEAASDIQREGANEWIDATIHTRLNDPQNDRIVLIMQRLHDDDVAGHFIRGGGWHVLKLPAEVKGRTVIGLGGKTWEYDDLLWPDRLSRDVLDDYRAAMGSYSYAGQLLQDPVPVGGGEFKPDYIRYFTSGSFDVRRCNLYICVDPASGKDAGSSYDQDYTAMAVWALAPDQNYYLIDGIKERLNPTERIDRMFALHRKWNARTGRPPKVGWEEYGLAGDLHYILAKQADTSYRFAVDKIPPKGAKRIRKEDRIRRLIPPMERGQVWLPNDIYVTDAAGRPKNFMTGIVDEEMLSFPVAKHDDFLDAMAMIFDMNPVFPKVSEVERPVASWNGVMFDDGPESVLDL